MDEARDDIRGGQRVATNPGSSQMCTESLRPLQRHRAGLPAGTSMMAPAGGTTCRFTPSYRRSNSSGGRVIRTSVWWVKGDRLISEEGASR